ncbi:hypothetical protein F5883DRAFT_590273 [Diaporthe sp. PMI_573]|nr:hypothetical protein F5883DRAFT_590273 [Diaporthaceae sp. PMI_573]
MARSSGSDIDGLLVTTENPPRGGAAAMDHARCAALHNYLVRYAWLADGRSPDDLPVNNTFFTTHGPAAEAIRPRLDPSLAAFLDAAVLPGDPSEAPPFFFWVQGLSEPEELFANETADLYDEPEDSLVCLYWPNIGQGGESGGGLYYHQGTHRAAVFMHMDDLAYALPVEAHPTLWNPLETVLSNWVELLQLGKITASRAEEPALFGVEKIGPWEWRPYSEAQVTACIGAWDRLCEAVEAEMPPSPGGSGGGVAAAGDVQLLSHAVLDAALVPEESFAHAFLSRARRPRFRHVAPGLSLPPACEREFASLQRFTTLPRSPQAVPPVCLFASERPAHLEGSSSPFCDDFKARSPDSLVPSSVPAGIYSESVNRTVFDNAEEGFRLLLPYGLRDGVWDEGAGARRSDGSVVGQGTVAELFQHGYKPFGGDYYRPQRLERLFDHWHKLVAEGIWSVGPQGVEGTIDTFKEADAERWRDYYIPPTW